MKTFHTLRVGVSLLLLAAGGYAAPSSQPGKSSESLISQAVERCRARASVDACYDAIRWKPGDPTLQVALGDALTRARRPVDALRAYRRAAALAPNLPGLNGKISAAESSLAARHTPGIPRHKAAIKPKPSVDDFSNTDPITATH